MRQRISIYLRWFLALNLLLGSTTASAGFTSILPGLGKSSIQQLEKLGVKSASTEITETGEVLVKYLGEDGATLASYVMAKGSQEAIEATSPSALRQYFSILKNQTGSILKQKLMHFPTEAFRFFVAIGAITTAELVFNFNDNPMAADQFFASQKDPVGQVGFAAFMMANGIVAEPLMAITKSDALRPFIPYLGMTVGMIASNVVHEVGMIVPQMVECAKTGQKCEEAYKIFTSAGVSEKFNEWMPNLFSMVGSTLASGGIESLIRLTAKGIQNGAKYAARMVGVELAFTLTPSGWIVRGGKWAYQISQLAGFVYLDTLFQAPMRFTWKSAIDIGPDLRLTDFRMGLLLRSKLTQGWKSETAANQSGQKVCEGKERSDCYMDLDQQITQLTKLMAKWREANLESVLTKQANWNQYVHELSSQYRTARQFYFDFVTDLWKKTKAPDYVHLMDRSLPLYGVKVKAYTKDEGPIGLLLPDQAEERQVQTVKDVVQTMRNSKHISGVVKELPKYEQDVFWTVFQNLASKDSNEVAEGIRTLRSHLGLDQTPGPRTLSSAVLRVLFLEIYKALGSPNPMMAPGQGYLKLVTENPDSPLLNNSPFPRGAERFLTPTAPEYLVTQMILGPNVEAGEKSVKYSTFGFPASFSPPMIRIPGHITMQPKYGPSQSADRSIFNSILTFENQEVGNIFDFVRQNGIRPEIIGPQEGSQISAWWEKYPEEEMFNAWKFFEQEYEETIQDFYKALIGQGDNYEKNWYSFLSGWKGAVNRSPFSNGILDSMQEEQFTYLYILDSYLKTTDQKKEQVLIPTKELEYSTLRVAKEITKSENSWTKAVIAEWTKAKDLLQKIKVAQKTELKGKRQVLVSRITNKEIEEQEKALIALIDQYPYAAVLAATKVKELDLPKFLLDQIVSPYRPSVGESQSPKDRFDAFDAGALKTPSFVAIHKAGYPTSFAKPAKNQKDSKQAPSNQIAQDTYNFKLGTGTPLSDFEKRTLTAALEGLKAVAAELSNYGQIINNVSYVENFDASALSGVKKKSCVKMPKELMNRPQNSGLRKYCEG